MIGTTRDIVADVERRAQKLNLSISEICRRARLARSTFERWKRGAADPALSSLNKVLSVLTEAERLGGRHVG